MKRYGNLFEKIVDYDNLMAAHKNAKKGKSHYSEVKMVNENPDYYIRQIQKMLIDNTFTTSPYRITEKVCEKKTRKIYALPYYPDRIIQHALIQVCGPIWMKTFIRDTFQSLVNRGTHDGFKRVAKAIKRDCPKYCLKIDIEKFYPSINNNILKQIIRKKIKCRQTLSLIDNIVDSTKGVPIGNYTSQYFGNLYLTEFDWWVKQDRRIKNYFRYCDDMIFLHDDKVVLHNLKRQIDMQMDQHGLTIKSNWQVFNIEKQGLDFIGYVFNITHIKLRPSIAYNLKTKSSSINRNYKRMPATKVVNCLMAYWGWIKYINAKNLWKRIMTKKMVHILQVKKDELK